MSKFDHAMMPKKPAPATPAQRPNRVHTVAPPEDEELDLSGDEDLFADDPLLQRELDKREAFEKLVLFKRPMTKEITVDGLVFTMKILTPSESSIMSEKLKDVPDDQTVSRLKVLTLCLAIQDVSGIKLEDTFSGPADIKDVTSRRYYELQQWPSPLINNLFVEYNKFMQEVEKRYVPAFLAEKGSQSTD